MKTVIPTWKLDVPLTGPVPAGCVIGTKASYTSGGEVLHGTIESIFEVNGVTHLSVGLYS